VVLTGSTPVARRQDLVDRFQTDPGARVFAANLVAGGVGITLTAARQVVFNDLDWVPANHWQAEDRAYRIGQTNTVNVTYFAAEETLDEFVAATLRLKAGLIEAVVEGSGDAAPGGDLLSELESLIRAVSPGLASLTDAESREDPIDRLLREAARLAAERQGESAGGPRADARALPAEAVLALARALSGSALQRYRVESSSKAGAFYVLDVEGGDVLCICPGFEYRGACSHARTLKKALGGDGNLPPGFRSLGEG
jgi:SWI/SNF-related matrix-associated actin-dependent regulator of chromatin subfamily A-like protein 1